jgi:hypothetical protein
MIVGAVAAILFLAAFFGGREAAVGAVPDLASLYEAIGLPVSLDGMRIEAVAASRSPTAAGDRVVVSGTIRNVSGEQATLPRLAAILYDRGRVPARVVSFDPPVQKIGVGEAVPFRLTIDGSARAATEIAVRFLRPGESLPQAVAQLSAQ